MCCNSTRVKNRKYIKEVKEKHGSTDIFIPVYKVLVKRGDKLFSPTFTAISWNIGINGIDCPNPSDYRNRNMVSAGIHVYRTMRGLKNSGYVSYDNARIVKLYALASSLLGTDGNHSVFATVVLTKEEYDKALSNNNV